jgi:hypothetical protein
MKPGESAPEFVDSPALTVGRGDPAGRVVSQRAVTEPRTRIRGAGSTGIRSAATAAESDGRRKKRSSVSSTAVATVCGRVSKTAAEG